MRESTGRAIRIGELKNILKIVTDEGKDIDEKKLVAELSLKWSIAIRKVREYLSLLIDSGEFIRTEKGIMSPASFEAQKILDKSGLIEKVNNGGPKK